MSSRKDSAACWHKRFAPGKGAGKRRVGIAFRSAEHALARVFRPILKDRGFTQWFAQQANDYAATQHVHELICYRSVLRREADPTREHLNEHLAKMYPVFCYIRQCVAAPEYIRDIELPGLGLRACNCNHQTFWSYATVPCTSCLRRRGGWIHPRNRAILEAQDKERKATAEAQRVGKRRRILAGITASVANSI